MKPYKADKTSGDTLDLRGFKHSERNKKIRRLRFKYAKRMFFRDLDKSEKNC